MLPRPNGPEATMHVLFSDDDIFEALHMCMYTYIPQCSCTAKSRVGHLLPHAYLPWRLMSLCSEKISLCARNRSVIRLLYTHTHTHTHPVQHVVY